MCGNRVAELETRVNELAASVEGLTDELVECKVRLRELESAADDDASVAAGTADSSNTEGAEGETREDEEADTDFIVA